MTAGSPEYIVFVCRGGPEIDLMGTAVVRAISVAYPDSKIVVTSDNAALWLHNPRVFRAYQYGRLSYFYQDFMEGKDTLVLSHDPFSAQEVIQRKGHLVDAWCAMCGVQPQGRAPELFFTHREKEAAQRILKQHSPKPFFFIQTSDYLPRNPQMSSWVRNMAGYVARSITQKMLEKGYAVFHLAAANEPILPGALYLALPPRLTLALIQESSSRLFINSYGQHAAASMNLPSTVLWNAESPEVFGHDLHRNIVAKWNEKDRALADSFAHGWDTTNMIVLQENSTPEPFSLDEIMESLASPKQ